MKSIVVAISLLFLFTAASTTNASSCEGQAIEKKLSGAAKTSFVKKCEKDATEAATKTCEGQASDKRLAGAAKTSFLKKCVKDATAG
jgi:hypothetical protein